MSTDTDMTDAMVQRYGVASTSTLDEIVKDFFKGVWSYPDDVGMAFAVSVSATGVLGPRLKSNAREVLLQFDSLICIGLSNLANLYHFAQVYLDYLKTSGRWQVPAAWLAGRTVGGFLTNLALVRVQRLSGRPVPGFGGRVAVGASLTMLALYGGACRAILAGDRTFIGILHAIITGEIDTHIRNLDLHFEFDAPWRQLIPPDADNQISELRRLLQQLCGVNRSLRS